MIKPKHFALFVVMTMMVSGCLTPEDGATVHLNTQPGIRPDYEGITIPPNIAPLNFIIEEPGDAYIVNFSNEAGYHFSIKAKKGKVQIPALKWKKLLESGKGGKIEVEVRIWENTTLKNYKPFHLFVANEPIDPYLVYRLIHPGYYNWSQIKIAERSTEDFSERIIIDNRGVEKNCVNCHSFNQNKPEPFMVHIRGSQGGTYISEENSTTRHDLKTDEMPGSATYPTWHPQGRYIAFSSNQVRQNFYAHTDRNIEVYDLVSSLILYDRQTNRITNITDPEMPNPLQTFPSWSSEGNYLFYCEAVFQDSTSSVPDVNDVKDIRYNLKRIRFNAESATFGKPEMVFDASAIGKSVSFPRISPDGRYMVITLTDFGTFPAWHNEADLYLLDLSTGNLKYLTINSPSTESYHSWSSNGRWLVFSSKRTDNRSSVPFFAYFRDADTLGKPFALPQKDPSKYDYMLESFNIPELVQGKVSYDTRDFRKAASVSLVKAIPSGHSKKLPGWMQQNKNEKMSDLERGIHE